MTMTRKDYQLLADVVRAYHIGLTDHPATGEGAACCVLVDKLETQLMDALQGAYPNFNRRVFSAACRE